MANIDVREKVLGASHAGMRGLTVLNNEIDCNLQNVASGDVVQALPVAPGDRVLDVVVTVKTAEGGTLTIDVGDGVDADGYLVGVNGNTAGMTGTELVLTEGAPNVPERYTAGKLYTAEDTIDMTFNNAADAAVIKVSALVARMG